MAISKPAWLITTYNQIATTTLNIHRIRRYEHLGNIPIIVVYTHPDKNIFDPFLPEFDKNVHLIHFKDAPGNPLPWYKYFKQFKSKSPKDADWRDTYIAARIMLSMRLGFIKAEELGHNIVFHLHSDSYWNKNYVGKLQSIADRMLEKKIILYGDQPIVWECENLLPPLMHFHPEGTIFNLEEARKCNYGFNFDEIYQTPNSTDNLIDANQFYTLHFGRTESLLGAWLLWSLTKTNVLSAKDISKVDLIYYDKIMPGIMRHAHGTFSNGLVNERGRQ